VRVIPDSTSLRTAPGGQVELSLEVVNTSPLIDGITVRVIGLDPQQVSSRPPMLPLFPDATGRLSLFISVPPTFPAGRHPLTVELSSSVDAAHNEQVDIDLVVEPRPHLSLQLKPAVRRGYRRGRFHVECHNSGNVPLPTTLTAFDPDRLMRCRLSDEQLTIDPGAVASTMLSVRAKRRIFGNDLNRPITIQADAPELGVSAESIATLRQRPLIARGMLTVVILACIIAGWAGAFLLGLTKVFAQDPLTKSAPASFFVSASADQSLRAASSPAGALAKSGTLPPGVGAGIGGTVTAASTGAAAGRIVVEALRPSRHGLVLEASAATQADGSYVLLGLLPGSYYVRFSAIGYRTSWYPTATTQAGAKLVSANAQLVTQNVNTNVVGLPASISGSVDPGDTLTRVRTVVTAVPLQGAASSRPVAKVTTDKNGNYTLRNLPAPGVYELGYTTPGYAPSTVVERVDGGQARSEPTVRLSAGSGTIAGVVSGDDGKPLGNVTVTTTQAGQQFQTATPTLGEVGRFAFSGVPTPGTYVLTFSRAGFGARTIVVDLGPGQQQQKLKVTLASGTGTVSGRLTDALGKGLGGATVTVGGTTAPVSTTTLTDGEVGTYAVSGLPTPGTYTLTFALPGYAPQTVPVNLTDANPKAQANAVLMPGVGSIAGRVVDDGGQPIIGANVAVTDGKTVLKTVTVGASGGTPAGGYEVDQLPPGTYTVTVTADGHQQETALVPVLAAASSCQNFALPAPGGTPKDPPSCA